MRGYAHWTVENGVRCVVSDIPQFAEYSAISNHATQSSCWWLTNTLRYCSILAFIHSIWPSVCGWHAVDILRSIPRRLHIWPQNVAANSGPLSETIFNWSPWRHTTAYKQNSANPGASIVVWQGMKCHIFKSLSTTTQIASNQSHCGNPTTNSMEMLSHGSFRTGKCWRTAEVECLEHLDCWQLWYVHIYWSTYFGISFKYYGRSKWSMVFARPRWPAKDVSWWSWIIHRRKASLSGKYILPLYHIRPFSFIHSAIVTSCIPLCVQIASLIFPGSGSVTYASAIRLKIEGWPWVCGLSANKLHRSGKFGSIIASCSIFLNLSSTPMGRSPRLLVKVSDVPFNFSDLCPIWKSNRLKNPGNNACLRFSNFFVMNYSTFIWSVNNWRGYAAPSHSGLHSLSAFIKAISSVPYIS